MTNLEYELMKGKGREKMDWVKSVDAHSVKNFRGEPKNIEETTLEIIIGEALAEAVAISHTLDFKEVHLIEILQRTVDAVHNFYKGKK